MWWCEGWYISGVMGHHCPTNHPNVRHISAGIRHRAPSPANHRAEQFHTDPSDDNTGVRGDHVGWTSHVSTWQHGFYSFCQAQAPHWVPAFYFCYQNVHFFRQAPLMFHFNPFLSSTLDISYWLLTSPLISSKFCCQALVSGQVRIWNYCPPTSITQTMW